MDKSTIKEVVGFLEKELLKQEIRLWGIAVFGSQLKGYAGKDSDLDLIVISKNFKNKNIFERSAVTMDAEIKTIKKYMFPMDVLKMTPGEYNNALKLKRYEAQLVD